MELGSYAVRVARWVIFWFPLTCIIQLGPGIAKTRLSFYSIDFADPCVPLSSGGLFCRYLGCEGVFIGVNRFHGLAAFFSAFLLWRLTNGLKSVVSRY